MPTDKDRKRTEIKTNYDNPPTPPTAEDLRRQRKIEEKAKITRAQSEGVSSKRYSASEVKLNVQNGWTTPKERTKLINLKSDLSKGIGRTGKPFGTGQTFTDGHSETLVSGQKRFSRPPRFNPRNYNPEFTFIDRKSGRVRVTNFDDTPGYRQTDFDTLQNLTLFDRAKFSKDTFKDTTISINSDTKTLQDYYDRVFKDSDPLGARNSVLFSSNILTGPSEPYVIKGIGQRWAGLNRGSFSDAGLVRGGVIVSADRTITDVERIGKFLISNRGLAFVAKQNLLQSFNAYPFYSENNNVLQTLKDITTSAIGLGAKKPMRGSSRRDVLSRNSAGDVTVDGMTVPNTIPPSPYGGPGPSAKLVDGSDITAWRATSLIGSLTPAVHLVRNKTGPGLVDLVASHLGIELPAPPALNVKAEIKNIMDTYKEKDWGSFDIKGVKVDIPSISFTMAGQFPDLIKVPTIDTSNVKNIIIDLGKKLIPDISGKLPQLSIKNPFGKIGKFKAPDVNLGSLPNFNFPDLNGFDFEFNYDRQSGNLLQGVKLAKGRFNINFGDISAPGWKSGWSRYSANRWVDLTGANQQLFPNLKVMTPIGRGVRGFIPASWKDGKIDITPDFQDIWEKIPAVPSEFLSKSTNKSYGIRVGQDGSAFESIIGSVKTSEGGGRIHLGLTIAPQRLGFEPKGTKPFTLISQQIPDGDGKQAALLKNHYLPNPTPSIVYDFNSAGVTKENGYEVRIQKEEDFPGVMPGFKKQLGWDLGENMGYASSRLRYVPVTLPKFGHDVGPYTSAKKLTKSESTTSPTQEAYNFKMYGQIPQKQEQYKGAFERDPDSGGKKANADSTRGLGSQGGDAVFYADDEFGVLASGNTKKYKSNLQDHINLHPYGGANSPNGRGELDVLNDTEQDFIPFKFRDMVNGKWIIFRAILESISDTSSPDFGEERYIGRPDKVYVYRGADRNVNITFKVMPKSIQELVTLWDKLNFLKGLTYPTIQNNRMIAPFFNLTLGDMFEKQPMIFQSLNYSIDTQSTWEIKPGLRLPKLIQCSADMRLVDKRLPVTTGKHYDFPWLKDYNNDYGTFDSNPQNPASVRPNRIKYKDLWDELGLTGTNKDIFTALGKVGLSYSAMKDSVTSDLLKNQKNIPISANDLIGKVRG